jgi:hypothetical protein
MPIDRYKNLSIHQDVRTALQSLCRTTAAELDRRVSLSQLLDCLVDLAGRHGEEFEALVALRPLVRTGRPPRGAVSVTFSGDLPSENRKDQG